MATKKNVPAAKTIAVKPAFPKVNAIKSAVKAPEAKPVKVKVVKLGGAVTVTRRNGTTVDGKVTDIQDKPNGRWITVNVGDKKKPDLVTARASSVVAK